ncbi:MAG: hypothetical protein AMJ75_06930 [Phycisphaerae bacterium SM1_79]|nr:MAG: hypothetical protein AMJ75_06930 [Phycisphaerae bacterium SM1_79]
MIKTLRITSVVAAILAGIFFVFSVFFGVRSDESIEEFLSSPSVIEQFKNAVGNETKANESRISPLVQQADAFRLYLNPPEPKTPRPPIGPGTTAIARQPAVTPIFPVIATSVNEARPELSLALIDEPGKGLHWVRPSDKVGHLSIEQIKSGLLVVKGTNETFELVAEQKPQKNFLEEQPPVSTVPAAPTAPTGPRSGFSASSRRRTSLAATRSRPPQPPPPPRDPEEDAKLEELVSRLKDLRRSYKSDKTDSGPNDEEKAAMMDELISNFKSSRVSAEEAQRLDKLGKTLKDAIDPNRSLPEIDSSPTEASLPTPDGSAQE